MYQEMRLWVLGQEHDLLRLPRCPDLGKTPQVKKPKPGTMVSSCATYQGGDYGQVAWLNLSLLPYLQNGIPIAALVTCGEFWGAFRAHSRETLCVTVPWRWRKTVHSFRGFWIGHKD